MNIQSLRSLVRARLVLAAAVASVAILALPSGASAAHVPVIASANCPTDTPSATLNTVCLVLQAAEQEATHGGAVLAIKDYAETTAAQTFAYQQAMDEVTNAFASAVEAATVLFEDAADASTNNFATYGANTGVAVNTFVGGSAGCALDPVPASPVLSATFQTLRTMLCANLPAVPSPGDPAPLIAQLEASLPLLEALPGELAAAAGSYQQALSGAAGTLATTAYSTTDALGAERVREAWYAVQCVRKGQYALMPRPTPCPQ